MKKILSAIISILSSALAVHLQAQELPVNSDPDGITGTYFVPHEGENSKVRIYAAQDGSFTAQVIWVETAWTATGTSAWTKRTRTNHCAPRRATR